MATETGANTISETEFPRVEEEIGTRLSRLTSRRRAEMLVPTWPWKAPQVASIHFILHGSYKRMTQ